MKFLLFSLLTSSALLTMAMDPNELFDIETILQNEDDRDLDWRNFEFKEEKDDAPGNLPDEKEKRARSPQIDLGSADQSEVDRSKMLRLSDITQGDLVFRNTPASSVPKSQTIPSITCLACMDKLVKSSAEKAARKKQIEEYLNTQRPSYIAHAYDFLPNSPVRRIAPICGLK